MVHIRKNSFQRRLKTGQLFNVLLAIQDDLMAGHSMGAGLSMRLSPSATGPDEPRADNLTSPTSKSTATQPTSPTAATAASAVSHRRTASRHLVFDPIDPVSVTMLDQDNDNGGDPAWVQARMPELHPLEDTRRPNLSLLQRSSRSKHSRVPTSARARHEVTLKETNSNEDDDSNNLDTSMPLREFSMPGAYAPRGTSLQDFSEIESVATTDMGSASFYHGGNDLASDYSGPSYITQDFASVSSIHYRPAVSTYDIPSLDSSLQTMHMSAPSICTSDFQDHFLAMSAAVASATSDVTPSQLTSNEILQRIDRLAPLSEMTDSLGTEFAFQRADDREGGEDQEYCAHQSRAIKAIIIAKILIFLITEKI
eukprot:jgi/Hompol1/1505/HPOL_003819-RA